jgi:hypothetical protein
MAIKFNPLSGQFDTVLDKAVEIKYSGVTTGLGATNVQDVVDFIYNNSANVHLDNIDNTNIPVDLVAVTGSDWNVKTSDVPGGDSQNIVISSGSGNSSGNASLITGSSVAAASDTGAIIIATGAATDGGGGGIQIKVGDTAAGFTSGNIEVLGSNGGTGSAVIVQAGNSTSGTDGGNIEITTGAGAAVDASGGDVLFTTGSGSGTGHAGDIDARAVRTLRLPRLAADPSADLDGGSFYYNTTANEIRVYDGASWSVYVQSTEVGAANGVASLDGGGKVPVSQLPNSIMDYLGTWAASTNTPTLADGTGNAGDVYIASDSGTVNFGAGNISFLAGDWVVYSGSVWQKSVNSNSVVSVNSLTGAVSLDTDDIPEGTATYFTVERSQDAVGAMVSNSSTVSLTYTDATPDLQAAVVSDSIENVHINSAAAIALSKLATVTASRALQSSASGVIEPSSVTNTELGYVSGVTSALQTQINGKEATITGAATTITSSDLTASRAVVSDASGKVAVSAATSAEVAFLSGVTSAVQTQIDAKMTNPMTTGGDLIYGGASGVPTRLANGSIGNVLISQGSTSAPIWGSASGTQSYTANTGAITLSAANDTLSQSGANANITLPSAAANAGKVFRIIHSGNFNQVYILLSTGGNTINGLSSGQYALYTPGEIASFQSDGVSNWKSILHQTTGPEIDLGALSISAVTTAPTKGVTTVDKWVCQRVGNRARLDFRFNTTGGTAGSGNYIITLPTGITIDTTYITPINSFAPGQIAAVQTIGSGQISTTTGPTNAFVAFLYPLTNITFAVYLQYVGGTTNAFWSSAQFPLSLVTGVHLQLDIPVVGWQP